ncbi:MAG TPA: hypothetical protein VG253_07440 [Streptosporangiaceae bacterium]|jgi:thiamine pyrophosphate-dependent acetolactate synthase large subunit-like protein|nr:hypothetical protein [Streptosporangiaceae bacterium]
MPQTADFVLERLREWGVHRIFGYPGDGINGMLGAFGRVDPEAAAQGGFAMVTSVIGLALSGG